MWYATFRRLLISACLLLVGAAWGGWRAASPMIPAEQGEFETGRFTIAVLPDTQNYSWLNQAIFDSQTEWIVQNRVQRNIVFVTHEGDIVEHNDELVEWARASQSMGKLDGVVPYGVLPGNTDLNRFNGSTAFYNQFFPVSRFNMYDWYGGGYPAGTNDNSFEYFSGNGQSYLILHLIYCPMPDVIQWANGVLQQHADKPAIVVTHAYLDKNGDRNTIEANFGCQRDSPNTAYIWDELVYPNHNVFLVLNGHEWRPDQMEVMRIDPNAAGSPVIQIGANYQGRPNGGDGWMRLLEFRPDEGRICVRTFSPWLNTYETDADSDFAISYDIGQAHPGASTALGEDACEPPVNFIYLPLVRNR